MSGTIIRNGRYYSGGTPGVAHVAAAMQWAYTGDNPGGSGSVIWYRLGARVGYVLGGSSSVTFELAVAETTSGTGSGGTKPVPGAIIRRSQKATTNVVMDHGAAGETKFVNLTEPFIDVVNKNYGFMAASSNNSLAIGMVPAASIGSSTNTWMYSKSAPSGVTQNGPGSGSNQGHMALWMEGEVNVKPNLPSTLSPSGSNLLIPLRPTLSAKFSDPNETLNNSVAWDRPEVAEVEIRTGGASGPVFWTSGQYTTTSAERSSKTTTKAPTKDLAYGVTYTMRWRHRDRGGLWSDWNSTTFSIKSPNADPLQPDNMQPVGVIGGSTAPTMSMRHRDPDGNAADYAQYRVVRSSDDVVMRDYSFPVSVANNGTVSWTYSGTGLSFNTTYYWMGRTRDTAGAWGPWSNPVYFEISSLANVDMPISPSGYRTVRGIGNIVAKYTHNTGLAAQAFKVMLVSSSGTPLATSGWINKSVASGSNVTITEAEAGFGDMSWGFVGGISVLPRDANGVEGKSWSPASSFRVNAPPSTPSGVSPSGTSHGSRPKIVVANCSDADPENPKSSLQLFAIITKGATSVTVPMVWNGSTWEFQTTAAELPGYDTYTVQTYSYDGIVYSGGSDTAAGASKSTPVSFIYAAVPVVTITGPSSPIETSQPTITWNASQTQASYRLRMYNELGAVIYDSGTVSSATTSHVISPAKFLNGERWNTGETFNVEVQSTSTSALTGTSARVAILLLYTAPDSLYLSGSPTALPGTMQANSMMLWHEVSSVSPGSFEGYWWYRWELDNSGNPIESTMATLTTQMNSSITTYLDAQVESGKAYRWGISVAERRGNDIVYSNIETFDGTVTWDGIVVHIPDDPASTAVEFYWSTVNSAYTFSNEWGRGSEQFNTISGERVFSLSRKSHRDARITSTLRNDTVSTAEEKLAALRRLLRVQGGEVDGNPHTACWRSGRGGEGAIIYGVIDATVPIEARNKGAYEVTIGIREAKAIIGRS